MTIPVIKKILKIIIFNVIQQLQNVMGCVYVKCPEKSYGCVQFNVISVKKGLRVSNWHEKTYVTFEWSPYIAHEEIS